VTFISTKEATMPKFSTTDLFAVGDLVAFQFPYADGGAKTRVCAIVAQDPERNEVVVAYGTSNLRLQSDPDKAVTLFARQEWQAAGLHHATRFQADRRIRGRMGDPRFKKSQSLDTAKVGQLTVSHIRRLSTIYDGLPEVKHHQERKGIHPKPANKTRRPSFLGRSKAAQAVAIAAI
jgi:hypothetical protein